VISETSASKPLALYKKATFSALNLLLRIGFHPGSEPFCLLKFGGKQLGIRPKTMQKPS